MQWLIDLVLESLTGMIVMWSGAIVDIPTGWALCDGNNGTPDLRNRFVRAAGDTFDPDDTGGANQHHHDGTTDGHAHVTVASDFGFQVDPGAQKLGTTSITDSFTTDNESTVPPYYALAYIMKT